MAHTDLISTQDSVPVRLDAITETCILSDLTTQTSHSTIVGERNGMISNILLWNVQRQETCISMVHTDFFNTQVILQIVFVKLDAITGTCILSDLTWTSHCIIILLGVFYEM